MALSASAARATCIALVAFTTLASTGCKRHARGRARAAARAATAARGAHAYARACAVCHGATGEGYRADNAPSLANPEFLATASDAFLRRAIVRGRPGTTMSAWAKAAGGPLDDADVAAVVRLIRGWQTAPRVALDPTASRGDPALGQRVFARECASCHGAEAGGGPYESLVNPEFLASAGDGFLRRAIERGRAGTKMPAFAEKLPREEIEGVVAWLRTQQKAAPPMPDDLPPRILKEPVLNPRGPNPTWPPDAQYTPVDAIKKAYDAGARMIIADARPPSSYVEGHVAGAVSIPFYDAKSFIDQLPKDVFVVTYCGCPHAESGQLLGQLRAGGIPHVTVMDEGWNVWRNRGYPVRTGAAP